MGILFSFSLSETLQGRPKVFLILLFALFLAFVVQFAALAKANGELDPGTFEMDVQGHQGQPFLIQLPAQFVDLAAMGQQLAHPQRLMVEVLAGLFMAGDVHVMELEFAVTHQAEAITQVGLTGPDGFHLSTN